MNKRDIKLSKFLSLVLRHHPEAVGITLDKNGWSNIDKLIDGMNEIGRSINRDILMEIVRTNDKRRFAVREDGKFIRAVQGHSIPVELDLKPMKPPEFLYHGTVGRYLNLIAEV